MNHRTNTPEWFAYVFPFVMAGMWLLVSTIDAYGSGWARLAKRFPGGRKPDSGPGTDAADLGPAFGRQYSMYRLMASPVGLHVRTEFLFRFLHPPVLVPWSQIEYSEGAKLWRWRYHELYLAREFNIQIRDKQYQAIKSYLTHNP